MSGGRTVIGMVPNEAVEKVVEGAPRHISGDSKTIP